MDSGYLFFYLRYGVFFGSEWPMMFRLVRDLECLSKPRIFREHSICDRLSLAIRSVVRIVRGYVSKEFESGRDESK